MEKCCLLSHTFLQVGSLSSSSFVPSRASVEWKPPGNTCTNIVFSGIMFNALKKLVFCLIFCLFCFSCSEEFSVLPNRNNLIILNPTVNKTELLFVFRVGNWGRGWVVLHRWTLSGLSENSPRYSWILVLQSSEYSASHPNDPVWTPFLWHSLTCHQDNDWSLKYLFLTQTVVVSFKGTVGCMQFFTCVSCVLWNAVFSLFSSLTPNVFAKRKVRDFPLSLYKGENQFLEESSC